MNIDLGAPLTWPPEVTAIVDDVASTISRRDGGAVLSQTPACDLDWRGPDDDADLEQRVRAAMSGRHILVYHATRLLPHEVDWIKNQGIGPLSRELRAEKLERAAATYPHLVTADDVLLVMNSGPLSWESHHQVRVGQLWVVAPIDAFAQSNGFETLLGDWGGESIAWAAEGQTPVAEACRSVIDELNAVSVPSIVELGVDPQNLNWWTDIWKVLVGRLLGAREAWNEWIITSHVPAGQVFSILQPDDPRWPRKGRQMRRRKQLR